ncbi:MAG: phenylalanine--tRNA ligase subunit beta [Candidatus Buchananbacteria bacterium RBG_13_39_9]|uniref:Phenylalanine--tRNA ligase beta subunit n=1 Tax=Candidatus Buchananbacteria bacterium RBG_13_39_9 TaxID=1797531 RepID=A0A1G1XMC0_9BACT|nr:MAG: phenylalanine--tRNA ligase subunit beta [Candidatus Buchananbacteria bacterium RBG_13_39_9]
MYISKNWLQDFVKIPNSLSAKELGLKLTMATAEVESIKNQAESLQGVIVGEILEIKKHPNADKLYLAIVDIGKAKLNIVCGAPNVREGQKVPVATIGAVLPNGMKIEKVKVRGTESSGMLCAEDELGLGKDHTGILILDKNFKVGEPLSRVLGLDDVIYEIENKTLTHRPDLWSHYGIAREVAAILSEKLKEYKVTLREPFGSAQGRPHHDITKLDIKIEDYKLCPRYCGVVLEGIKIEDSPKWMQKRLEAVGMRAINNIVDITNYVMMEIGQPLHAFDYDKLAEHRIVVRNAKKGEKIKTLDDQDRELNESILVIADANKPVAIAGIMGGANTEIDNFTKKIIIESANFDHVSIRQTEAKLGLRSEASIRFEKSLDPNLAEWGIKRAVELILQLCPSAKIVSQITDVKKFQLNQGPLKVSLDFLNKKIGQEIPADKIVKILTNLGFEVKKGKTELVITVPTWRATKDISIPEDIVEEVARIFGYDNLKVDMPLVDMKRPEINKERELERKIKQILAYGFGLNEVYNYSFVSEEQLEKIGLETADHVKILNPQAKELNLLRRSLIPNLLDNAALNCRNYDDFGLFEIGSIYWPEAKGEKISNKEEKYLPLQVKLISGVITEKKNDKPFYIAKNVIAGLFAQLHFDYKLEKITDVLPFVKKNRAVKILVQGKDIGYISEAADNLYDKLGLKSKVAIFEFNLTKLTDLYSEAIKYKPIPKFPSIDLDISMIIAKKILWEEIYQAVREVDKDLIRKIMFFDVYEGQGIPEGKKSIAFRIEYRSDDKTLTMEEVQVIHQKVLSILESKFSAQIRK